MPLDWEPSEGFFGIEGAHGRLPCENVPVHRQAPPRFVPTARDPRKGYLIRPWLELAVMANDLGDRSVVNPSNSPEQGPDRAFVPGLRIAVAFHPPVEARPSSTARDTWPRRPKGGTRWRGMAVATHVTVEVFPAGGAA